MRPYPEEHSAFSAGEWRQADGPAAGTPRRSAVSHGRGAPV